MTRAGGLFFLWQYTLPHLADFFTGIVYYFAGLLIADRQARLYGSRVVPLVGALTASALVIAVPWFTAALVIAVAFAALFAAAALGSAVSRGYQLHAPAIWRLATVMILLLAFSLLLAAPMYHLPYRSGGGSIECPADFSSLSHDQRATRASGGWLIYYRHCDYHAFASAAGCWA